MCWSRRRSLARDGVQKACIGPEFALKSVRRPLRAPIWGSSRQGVTSHGDLSEYAEGSVLEHGRLREIQNRFADVRHHLKSLPGFLHLTWWTHPQDPTWHNEVSFWTSYEALNDWHTNTYHKHAKEWAVRSGAIMEDIITNFEFKRARLIRVCPTCANIQDKPFDLHIEQAVLAEPCPKCGYHFPMMPETRESTAVFKDVPELATPL